MPSMDKGAGLRMTNPTALSALECMVLSLRRFKAEPCLDGFLPKIVGCGVVYLRLRASSATAAIEARASVPSEHIYASIPMAWALRTPRQAGGFAHGEAS